MKIRASIAKNSVGYIRRMLNELVVLVQCHNCEAAESRIYDFFQELNC